MSSYKPSSQQTVMPTRRMRKTTIMSNFIHHQVIEKTNKQKTIYNKHQKTICMLAYQAVTHITYKINCK